jgi:AbrB family looped-hinge helix DNA binding protein
MARVTSKLQVTIPKAIAERYGIAPGEEVDWLPAGDAIRVVPHSLLALARDPSRRLDLFDAATERQRGRDAQVSAAGDGDRGWSRDELYERGSAR